MRGRFLLAISFWFWLNPAFAHSAFQRSEPAANAVLKESPNEIRIWFSEPIKISLSTFAVKDATGKQVDKRDLHLDAKEAAQVCLSLSPHLEPGIYRVTWNAVAQDLHVGKGGFTFRITAPGGGTRE